MSTFSRKNARRFGWHAMVSIALLLSIPNTVKADPMTTDTSKTVQHPIYPISSSTADLKRDCEPFLAMSDAQLLALVPPQAGFFFENCPNCDQGDEDNQITWNIALGDKVQCKYCKAILPSEKYSDDKTVVVKTPTGKQQTFHYYQGSDGKKYWFEGRRWYEQRILVEKAAYALAQFYALDKTQNAEAGRRAALILKRFADVYPDYIVHSNYPGVENILFTNGNSVAGYEKLPDGAFRVAKWSWWAYMDISRDLLQTYDLLYNSGQLTPADKTHIETDLFQAMLDFVTQYDGTPLNNMFPTLWASQIVASRVLNKPAIADKALTQMRQLIRENFTYDGVWEEGTPSYHLQSAGGLHYDLRLLRPDLTGNAFEAWLNKEYPDLARAINAVDAFRLPNGRYAAVNDSWSEQDYSPRIDKSQSYLLPGMGYGVLGTGAGKSQLQAHLKWSGRYGHEHYDSLSLLLFGEGQELASDIGYTHTKARAWTMATAAHNTVLIDGLNQLTRQAPDLARGNVVTYEVRDPSFQVVSAEAPNAYPNAKKYQRTLLVVAPQGSTPYVVDVFDVAGGSRHDWLLHGSADDAQTLELTTPDGKPLALQPKATLLPEGFHFKPLTKQGDYDYITNGQWALGNFRDLQTAPSDSTVVATFRNLTQPQAGLRTWVLGAPSSQLTTARSWAVRHTGVAFQEDESKLDEHLRATLFVQRNGKQNRFVAVHQPLASTPDAKLVQRVTQIPLAPDGFALKIERSGGTDYLLLGEGAKVRSGHDGKLKFAFDGRIALAQAVGKKFALKMLDGTSFRIGSQQLKGTAQPAVALLKIENNLYTVAGHFSVAAGEVFTIRHGDGRTSSFHVAAVKAEGTNTVIETVEPPALSGAVDGVLEMLTFPNWKLPAPHTVATTALTTSTH
jgi:hypothetical protein